MPINVAEKVLLIRRGGSLTAVVEGINFRKHGPTNPSGVSINAELANPASSLRRQAEEFLSSTEDGEINLGSMRVGNAGGVFIISAKDYPFDVETDIKSHDEMMARVEYRFGGKINHYCPVEDRDWDAPLKWGALDGGAAGRGDYPIRTIDDLLHQCYEEAFGEIGISIWQPGLGLSRVSHRFEEFDGWRINQVISHWWEQAYGEMPSQILSSRVVRLSLPDTMVLVGIGTLENVCLAFELDNASLECLIRTRVTIPNFPAGARLRFQDLEMGGNKPLHRKIGLILVGEDNHRTAAIYHHNGRFDSKSHLESIWESNSISSGTEKFKAIRGMIVHP